MASRKKPGHPGARAFRRRIVILGLPPVDALDVIGPAEVFSVANVLQEQAGLPAAYTLHLVAAGSSLDLASETGIGLMAYRTLEQERRAEEPVDTLIVASGMRAADEHHPQAIEWIRERAPSMRRICSICVGAFALAETGLLDGRKATTHWCMARRMADRYPRVQVDPNPIWIRDGKLYTSAGISTGIDLALALVGEDLGNELALQVAKALVLFLRRPGGQAQFSVALRTQQASGSSLDELCLWIGEHLNADLSVEALAHRSSTSVRTLIRAFQRELQTTPAKYVEEARLESACRALELGVGTLEEIARRCGYRSVDVLRKAFTRRIGVSPREYAQRFAAAAPA